MSTRRGFAALEVLAGLLLFGTGLAGCGGAQPFETPPVAAAPAPAPSPVSPVVPGSPAEPPAEPPPAAAEPASSPARGAGLFATVPAPGQLACNDCHSDDPLTRNFGNIFVGRNAPALIERAIVNNTGGMGYFARYLSRDDIEDIAAYLGNSPASVAFADTLTGGQSPAVQVTVRSSTRQGIPALSFEMQGDFVRTGGDCADALARFASCTVELAFRPKTAGSHGGALLIRHDGAARPIRIPLQGVSPGQGSAARGPGAPGSSRHA